MVIVDVVHRVAVMLEDTANTLVLNAVKDGSRRDRVLKHCELSSIVAYKAPLLVTSSLWFLFVFNLRCIVILKLHLSRGSSDLLHHLSWRITHLRLVSGINPIIIRCSSSIEPRTIANPWYFRIFILFNASNIKITNIRGSLHKKWAHLSDDETISGPFFFIFTRILLPKLFLRWLTLATSGVLLLDVKSWSRLVQECWFRAHLILLLLRISNTSFSRPGRLIVNAQSTHHCRPLFCLYSRLVHSLIARTWSSGEGSWSYSSSYIDVLLQHLLYII